MENLKFTFFSILLLILLGLVGYWAFKTIESGSSHLKNQELKKITQENKELKEEMINLKNQIIILQSQIKKEVEISSDSEDKVSVEKPIEKPIEKPAEKLVFKYQTLINEIQKLVDDNIFMKKGSQGSRVGTVQKFLNLYNNTSTKIDNDYGPGMETAIKKFQTEQKITADGEAGPSTFNKMIQWLEKQ
jgi:cell division protein FtsB